MTQGGQGVRLLPPIECCFALLRTNNEQVSDFHAETYFKNSQTLVAPANASFDLDDIPKLRDLAKLWFFKLNMTKSNFQKLIYDVIVITSPN